MITRPGVEQDVSFFVHDLGAANGIRKWICE